MKATKVKPFQHILIEGQPVWIIEVEISGYGVIFRGFRDFEVEVWDTMDIELCTREGIPTEGRTEAEIKARQCMIKFDGFSRFTTELSVETTETGTMATVWIRENEVGGASVSATWQTYTSKGRTYTRLLSAVHFRSIWHAKNLKGSVRLTPASLKREINWFLTLGEFQARREAPQNV